MHWPTEVQELIHGDFHFPKQPLFGTIASIKEQKPNVRTMRIYAFEQGCPILLTHTGSAKWQEFVREASVSICLVSDDRLKQVMLRGHVVLSTRRDGPELAQHYWGQVRADVKEIYDPHYPVDVLYRDTHQPKAPGEVPPTFGIVRVVPDFWETLRLMPGRYTESLRMQFRRVAHGWEAQRVTVA